MKSPASSDLRKRTASKTVRAFFLGGRTRQATGTGRRVVIIVDMTSAPLPPPPPRPPGGGAG